MRFLQTHTHTHTHTQTYIIAITHYSGEPQDAMQLYLWVVAHKWRCVRLVLSAPHAVVHDLVDATMDRHQVPSNTQLAFSSGCQGQNAFVVFAVCRLKVQLASRLVLLLYTHHPLYSTSPEPPSLSPAHCECWTLWTERVTNPTAMAYTIQFHIQCTHAITTMQIM